MHKKQILALYFLTLGIIAELVLMTTLIADRNIESQWVNKQIAAATPASTISLSIAQVNPAQSGEAGSQYEIDPETGELILPGDYTNDPNAEDLGWSLDDDHPLGSEPSDSDAYSGHEPDTSDNGYSEDSSWDYPPPELSDWDGDYPAPQIDDPNDDYSNDDDWDDDDYPDDVATDDGSDDNYSEEDPWDNGASDEDDWDDDGPASEDPTEVFASTPVPTLAASVTPGSPTATGTPAQGATQAATKTLSPTPPQPTRPAQPSPTGTPDGQVPSGPELVSVRAAGELRLDGVAGDSAWVNAPPTTIKTTGGANQSATRVMVQSIHDEQNVYFLLTWADPTNSFLNTPWEKQANGEWKRLVSPENQGGDENQFYEDMLALFWPVGSAKADFSARGCAGACHTGENPSEKAYGSMNTPSKGQRWDLWQWKSVRNLGQVDDQYLDATPYTKDRPDAGFHNDPSTSGGYSLNRSEDRKSPVFMPPNGGSRTGAPGFILDAEKTALIPNLFQPGDRVPSMIVAPFQGDRGQIQAVWSYANGVWTLEIRRALVTGSEFDVQFDDLSKTYYFGLATFDNAQVRHAFQNGATVFRFEQ